MLIYKITRISSFGTLNFMIGKHAIHPIRTWKTIWAKDADSGQHSTPTITKISAGQYVVTGRMIRMDNMITRSVKLYDFDDDGLVDWKTTWNINGKYDLRNIEKLAASSDVVKIRPIWD